MKRLAAAILTAAVAATGVRAEPLVEYRIEGDAIPEPLTATPGNPARGRQLVRDMGHVTCLICHALPIPEEPDHGAVGPSLSDIASRASIGQIRLRLVDPKALNPQTIMPSYYRLAGLTRVEAPYRDRPIYSAQQVEDVVAYLASLKEP